MKKFLTGVLAVLVVFAILAGGSIFIYRRYQKAPKIDGIDIEEPVKPAKQEERPYEEVVRDMESSLEKAEEVEELEDIVVDVFIFMGQSNMAGNGGDPALAPPVEEGAGYEFRAVSDPTKLYTIVEPFGFYENKPMGISDGTAKRGSLVSAFVNEYHKNTGVPVVAVSCSQGATHTGYWVNPGAMGDAVSRLKAAVDWLSGNGYEVRHKYMVWLQGESDAIYGVSQEVYAVNMDIIINSMIAYGVEKCFVIRVGRARDNPVFTDTIQKVQTEICKNDARFMMASTMLAGFDISYMVDEWHYNQKALNLVGEDAAKNIAYYVNNGWEPAMYDYKYGNEYMPIEAKRRHEEETPDQEVENEAQE